MECMFCYIWLFVNVVHVVFLQMAIPAWDAVEQTWYPKPEWRPSRWPSWLLAPLLSAGHPTTSLGSGTGSNQPWSGTHLSMCITYYLSLATWTHAVTRSSMASTHHLSGLTLLTWWRAAVVTEPTTPHLALWTVCQLDVLELLWKWSLILAQTSTVGTLDEQGWSNPEDFNTVTKNTVFLKQLSAVSCTRKATHHWMVCNFCFSCPVEQLFWAVSLRHFISPNNSGPDCTL